MEADSRVMTSVDELKAKSKGAIAIGPFGSKMKSDCYVPSGVPVIRGTNISDTKLFVGEMVCITPELADKLGNAIVHADDLVFPHRGAIGQVGIVPRDNAERYALSSSLMKLTCDRKKADPFYLFYYFRSAEGRHELLKNASTVGTPGIGQPLSSLRSIQISLPSLAEQKSVAHILGTLDDKIELNRRMNATLEAMAQALYQSWFVDFDPVKRNAEEGPQRPEDSLFPDSFEDSEMGEIPKGWHRIPIADVCDINGWTLSNKDDLPNLEYVEISEVDRGDIANISNYSRGEEPSRARRRLRHGDTVLSTVRPDRGSYFLALDPPSNRVASTGFAVLTPTKVPWSYVHAAMTQSEVFEHLGHVADGGAYPAVRPEIVGAWKVAVPDNSKILDAFHRTCAPLFEKAEANRIQSRTLATFRETLLPKLLSGEQSVASTPSIKL